MLDTQSKDQLQFHTTVLKQEAIAHLKVQKGKNYVDCTLGDGGHTIEILKLGGNVVALDRDPAALDRAQRQIDLHRDEIIGKYIFVNTNYSDISNAVPQEFLPISGILYDLGTSFHQLDDETRGFSFNSTCDLDMRMDPNLGVTAKDLVNALPEVELARMIYEYGEDRFAKRIARAIVTARKDKQISKCNTLAKIIEDSVPRIKGTHIHPSTRTFQALRIAVNSELESFERSLMTAADILEKDGRIVIITFHSLEDIIAKKFAKTMKEVIDKPLIPSAEEVQNNPRARSAKLRVFEK